MNSCERDDLNYQLICVAPTHVEMLWPYVEPLIQAAVEKQNLSDLAVVKHDLLNGGALLWIAWNGYNVKAAAVTQCALANGDKFCTITACGGHDSKEWLPLIHGLEVYAKQEGCSATRILVAPVGNAYCRITTRSGSFSKGRSNGRHIETDARRQSDPDAGAIWASDSAGVRRCQCGDWPIAKLVATYAGHSSKRLRDLLRTRNQAIRMLARSATTRRICSAAATRRRKRQCCRTL